MPKNSFNLSDLIITGLSSLLNSRIISLSSKTPNESRTYLALKPILISSPSYSTGTEIVNLA